MNTGMKRHRQLSKYLRPEGAFVICSTDINNDDYKKKEEILTLQNRSGLRIPNGKFGFHGSSRNQALEILEEKAYLSATVDRLLFVGNLLTDPDDARKVIHLYRLDLSKKEQFDCRGAGLNIRFIELGQLLNNPDLTLPSRIALAVYSLYGNDNEAQIENLYPPYRNQFVNNLIDPYFDKHAKGNEK